MGFNRTGYKVQGTSYKLQGTGCKLQVAGYRGKSGDNDII